MKYKPVVAEGKEIETPEGVPIRFVIAPAGDRIAAFMIDVILILIAAVAVVWFAVLAGAGGWLIAAVILVVYFLLMFSWIWFEMRWQGQTPGKRWLGIRVIDRFGGQLRADAVFVRNVTRQVETLIPFAALSAPEALFPGAPKQAQVVVVAWAVILGLVPLFNRDRMRLGDLLAGTIVVKVPRARLLGDLGKAPLDHIAQTSAPRYAFTREQLSIYGIYELQVLEELLRQPTPERRAIRTVFNKVVAKIGWEDPGNVDARAFLEEFYTAQRAFLEQQMLFGKRREHKDGAS